jgi:regulator of replication initiation timing
MEQVIAQLKEGRYNEAEAGKYVSDEEIRRLQNQLEDLERDRRAMMLENDMLKAESEKVHQYQSAF